jgi:hypothetical protein
MNPEGRTELIPDGGFEYLNGRVRHDSKLEPGKGTEG